MATHMMPSIMDTSSQDGVAAADSGDNSVVEFQPDNRLRKLLPSGIQCEHHHTLCVGDDRVHNDDISDVCTICFEMFDNSGYHRVAALQCGHLFGLGCVEKWLKGQGQKCPTCNEKAKLKDIRIIYAKSIKSLDTAERDRALCDLEMERERCRKVEVDAAHLRLLCHQLREDNLALRADNKQLRRQLASARCPPSSGAVSLTSVASSSPSASSQDCSGRFEHTKTVQGGECRVMTFCEPISALVISQPSPNCLFPGFGIKKLSCLDLKTSSYVTLHQKPVRAISLHCAADDSLLLSVSMDKTVKLTNVMSSSVVQTYSGQMPLWSCEWNADDKNYFYVGQQNGLVMEFDIRQTGAHTRLMNTEGSKSPVVGLQYLSGRNMHANFRPSGLLVGQLDRVTFLESVSTSDHRPHILPLEGNLTSLHVDHGSKHLLASFRPTSKHLFVRHLLCQLTSNCGPVGMTVSCNVVHTFRGGQSQTVLGNSILTSHPSLSRLVVVTGDEQSESAHVWDTGSGQVLQRLACQGVPVDFTAYSFNNQTYLAALTDKTVKVHRWHT